MRYEHDCDICEWLAQVGDFDVYYCPANNTIVYRYGENSQYITTPMNNLCKPINNSEKGGENVGSMS